VLANPKSATSLEHKYPSTQGNKLMPVNLAASQSAITTDTTSGITHVVWANNGSIWHAEYDGNSGTWINAQTIAFAGTEQITELNLVASSTLVGGLAPGLAVIWQQGSLNNSDFYYTAAQYDQNLDLQWLPTPQALTSDQVGDLEPTVTVNDLGEITVVGTKVNFINSANLGISEDTDLYFQQFKISSDQFTSSTSTQPQASYAPQLSKNGVINLGVFSSNTQAASQPIQSAAGSTPLTSLSTSSETGQSEQQPIGSWNSQIYFSSNLLEDWKLMESVPKDGFLRSIINPFMKKWELEGTLLGGTTLWGGEESIVLQSNATLQWKSPYTVQSPWLTTTTTGPDWSSGDAYRHYAIEAVKLGFELESTYVFGDSNPYPLSEIEDILKLTASLKLPVVPAWDTAGFYTLDLIGSVGLNLNLTAKPDSSGGQYSPETLKAYAASLVVGAFGESVTLAKALADGNEEGVIGRIAASLALNVAETVAAAITGAATGLDLDISVSFPVFKAGLFGKVQIPHLPILEAEFNGGVETAFNWAISSDTNDTITLSFPLGVEAKVGPLGFGFNYNPGWQWDVFSKDSSDSSASNDNSETTSIQSTSTLLLSTNQSASVISSTLAGSLLTVDFGIDLAQLPSQADFNVTTQLLTGETQTIPIFNIAAGSSVSSVVLQLEQSIPLSENTTFNSSGESTSGSNPVYVSYTNNNDTKDASGNPLENFSDINATIMTPNALSYVYSPTSGNSQNYTAPTLFLNFAESLDITKTPDPARFTVSSGAATPPTISSVQVLTNGVSLVFDANTTVADLQSCQIVYTSEDSSSSGQTFGQQLIAADSSVVPSFTIQNGFSALVSQTNIIINDTNPAIELSTSTQDYSITVAGSSSSFSVVGVTVNGNGTQAILNLNQAISPEQIVSITLSSNYIISNLVNGSVPPAVSTQSLISTVEADLGQDSSPVLIQTNGQDSSSMLVWVADAPPLLPLEGIVYQDSSPTSSSVTLTFSDDLAIVGDQYLNTLISQFTIIDTDNNNYSISNVSFNNNTLQLSLGQVAADAELLISYQPSQTSTDGNLSLSNTSTNTNLWVPQFENLSLINSVGDTGAPVLLSAGVSVEDASTNQIVLIFNNSLTDGGVSNNDFKVLSNGQTFSILESVSVSNNTVTLLVQPPSSSIDLIGSGDQTTVTYTGTSLSGGNKQTVANFTDFPVITAPNEITTVLKYALGSSTTGPAIANIPGAGGFNFNPAGVYTSGGGGATVLVWSNANTSDINTNLLPGSFYTVNDASIINNSLNESNLYYSIYSVSKGVGSWSPATVITSQQGSEGQIALGTNNDGQVMAAWINNYNGISTVYAAELTPSSSTDTTTTGSSDSTTWSWSSPVVVYADANPDPLTELSIVTLNGGNPAIFWTRTQPTSYSQLTFDESPILYYRLADSANSSAGITTNTVVLLNQGSYGAGGNGTYSGTSDDSVAFNQQSALEPSGDNTSSTNQGDPNPSVLFLSGSSATSAPIPIVGNSFSIEFWYQIPIETLEVDVTLISIGDAFSINLVSDALTLDYDDVAYSWGPYDQVPLTWYYGIATYDDASQLLSLYINGNLSTSYSTTINLPDSAAVTLADASNSRAIQLDEVAFYGQALAYNEIPDWSDFDNLTPSQISNILFNSNPIGNKYNSRYGTPLPAGPNTYYAVWDGTAFDPPSSINPTVKPVATQLSDANTPLWDIASYSNANSKGLVNPNGVMDIYLPLSLGDLSTGVEISSITVKATNSSDEEITWSVGSSPAVGQQLAVVQGNKLLNPRNPSNSFSYTILGQSVDLALFIDPGANSFSADTSFTVTVNYSNNLSTTVKLLAGDVTAEPTPVNSNQVIGTATVTELNDLSLTTIDSGFVINTNNANMGYSIVSADFNNDTFSDVAIGNRGYTGSTVSSNGSVQVLFGRGAVLSNAESNPLTMNDLSGNPDGLLITGIPDSGETNGDFPFSMANGDVNGDGIADLVIGDPNSNAVYVIYGASNLAGTTIDVSSLAPMGSTTPSPQGYVINSPTSSNIGFGYSVAVGNFNSNFSSKTGSYPAGTMFDIVIGAPGAQIPISGETDKGLGEVFVAYDGNSTNSTLQSVFQSKNPKELAGYSVAVSSRLTGVTFTGNQLSDDIIIGAIGYEETITNQWQGLDGLPSSANNNPNGAAYPTTSTANQGAVYVLKSTAPSSTDGSSTTASYTQYASYTGSNQPSSNGTPNDTYLGSALTSFDLSGDTINDLVISSPGDADNQGVIYVLKGGETSNPSSQVITTVANLAIVGGLPFSQTGTAISSPGDLNDDNYDDLLITAPNGANGTGQSYVVFGNAEMLDDVGAQIDLNITANDDQSTFLLNGSEPYQLAGAAVSGVGDVNGDTVNDLMISAPNAGQLYIVYGHPWLADDGSIKLANISGDNGFIIDGDLYTANGVPLAGMGSQVVMLGDVNGDGFADVLTGGAASGANGAILAFGASTQDLLDAAAGTDELVLSVGSETELIRSVTAAGDFNGDGLADFGVIIYNQSQNTSNFYLINGNPNLGQQTTLTVGGATPSVANVVSAEAVGDYNGDGYDDIILIQNGVASPYVLLGNSSSALGTGVSLPGGNNNVFNGIGDPNGDGSADIGGGNPTDNGSAAIYFGFQGENPSAPPVKLSPPTFYINGTLVTDSSDWNINSYGATTKYNSSPSFVEFNNSLYMAYTSVTSSGDSAGSLSIQRSFDGSEWSEAINFQDILGQASTGISLAVFNNNLYAAFLNTDAQLVVAMAESNDSALGIQFNSPSLTGNQASYVTPAMVSFNGELYVFYATGGEYESEFEYYSSTDGESWDFSGENILSGKAYGYLPLGASFAVTAVNSLNPADSNLYLSFATANNSSTAQGLTLATSYDPDSSWTTTSIASSTSTNPVLRGTGLLGAGSTLYNFYLPNSNNLNVLSSVDSGQSWTSLGSLETFDSSSNPGIHWYTYPNPVIFQEKLFIGMGMQYNGSSDPVLIGYANSTNHIFQSNQTQQFGSELMSVGDFNGDGIGDFAILAPGFYSNLGLSNNGTYENNQGAVLIYYGSLAGLDYASSPDLIFAAPPPSAQTNTATNQVLLFTEMAAAGDINGDGYDDILIASPSTALDSQSTTPDGNVFVVFGGGESLWAPYSATSPFNLGLLSPSTNIITLYFPNPLDSSLIPASSTFTVQTSFTSVSVESVGFNNANDLVLTLESSISIYDDLVITYTPPTSGTALTSINGSLIKQFTSSNVPIISTLGAPSIVTTSYDSYGFMIQGLPNSEAGIALDGGGDVNGDGFSDFIVGAPGSQSDDLNLTYTLFGSDFNNTVNQTGTIGNDAMLGSPTGESFVAGQGNDSIYSGGGVDVVYAGIGDDYVTVNDAYFRRLDGGPGLDVLAFQGYSGQDWDLTTLSPGLRLRNFEILVTENYGANTLSLNSLSVQQLSPSNTLTVILDDTDLLELSKDFSFTSTVYQYNSIFYKFESSISAASVLVNQPTSSVSTTAPSTNTPAPIYPSSSSETASSTTLGVIDDPIDTTNTTTTTNNNLLALDAGQSDSVATASQSIQSSSPAQTKIFVSNPKASEVSGRANFTISRTGDLNQYVWVDYYTKDGDAKAGDRYTPVAGQMVFAPGESSKTVTVPIPNNGKYVGNRQFGLVVQLEGESTDPNVVPDTWQAAVATPNEQVRRWNLVPEEQGNSSITFNVTSSKSVNNIVTLDLDLDGTVLPLIWNPSTSRYQDIPFNNSNGIVQVLDSNEDLIIDLYRLKLQDGGPFDGDGLVNGLVALNFDINQLETVEVPTAGGRLDGTKNSDFLNAQNSTGTTRLEGLGGNDVLIGSPQRDVLLGGDDNDILLGGGNIDQLYGGPGDDLLDGGLGINFLYGGVGADNFVLRSGDGPHRIMDFNSAQGDSFLLNNLSMTQLSFLNNQIMLGSNTLATVVNEAGKPVTNFASNPSWFTTVIS
jgi:hypothetical protein